VRNELLTTKAKKLLLIESVLFVIPATMLLTMIFSRSYTFHFQQVTLNYYTDGTSDFTTNVTSLVKSLGTVALFSLIFGGTAGAAIGLTLHSQIKTSERIPSRRRYEQEMTNMGFVVINKTDQGTTYTLTELGRRFLRDYRFLEEKEEVTVQSY
jgi:hypothetical protein